MKLASIVPMKNVERTFEGEYAMLLAHLSDYYPHGMVKKSYNIMDNSLIELGGSMGMGSILERADTCGPWIDEIILPDVYRDAKQTLNHIHRDIGYLRSIGRLDDYNLMAVCQGSTYDEFIDCFLALNEMTEIHTIGIPKVCATLNSHGRTAFEFLWNTSMCKKDIHLLGVWDSLDELRRYENPERIRSVDTCIPALFACRGTSTGMWSCRPKPTIRLEEEQIIPRVYDEILAELRKEKLL